MALTLMYITNDPEIAITAQKYGVDRIWIDLETIGKKERQNNRDSVKSNHTIEDIRTLRPLITKSELLVRINDLHDGSEQEIEQVVRAGADMIMLPMWKSADDVRRFIDTVHGRTKTTLLLETREAEECLDDVLDIGGFDEIHIGLNDLHIAYDLDFMFELLTNGTVENIVRKIKNYDIPYGFGGIAKIGYGDIPAEKIILEHYRLGSTRAILSRSFCDNTKIKNIEEIDKTFNENLERLRGFEKLASCADDSMYEENKNILKKDVNAIVQQVRRNRRNK